ncbi:MAG TPA: NAD(+) synthase [Leptospiraceae bacterium]|nr:NAD(+) synthase [Leptospiraceae bacterium]HNN07077.1 NAD(+) synthase [Leptospiraceae bacterium]
MKILPDILNNPRAHGFLRAAAVSPKVRVGDPDTNTSAILAAAEDAAGKGCEIILFPELCITGYTCADLFSQGTLLKKAEDCLLHLKDSLPKITAIVGVPLEIEGGVWNCAAVLQDREIRGIVPKAFLPNSREFYEGRWFTRQSPSVPVRNVNIRSLKNIPFGSLLFRQGEVIFGIEICEDLWVSDPPSSRLYLQGADIIFNPSASPELAGKSGYRKDLVSGQSARCIGSYVYASAGPSESTTDLVFSGHCIIAEYGTVLDEKRPRLLETDPEKMNSSIHCIAIADIDWKKTRHERIQTSSFQEQARSVPRTEVIELSESGIALNAESEKLLRSVDPFPFAPKGEKSLSERSIEIFDLLTHGLVTRLVHTQSKHIVLGLSGGLDSTLALLVARRAMTHLGWDISRVVCISMPGMGTSSRTKNNSENLAKVMGTSFLEISIVEAVQKHFQDIGLDPNDRSVTFENCQARERTQILMDYANKVGGFVLGTGDLSEMALGWSTYNGDHMSMYAVNSSIPKTLVKHLVSWASANLVNDFGFKKDDSAETKAREVLLDIVGTPISPELLPPDEKGEITQKTEESVGKYDYIDFFLYHTLRWGASPSKIVYLAMLAFGENHLNEIIDTLSNFYKRFFSQQFKRNCTPDGPKVGSVTLSPRGDWKMPSDAHASLWLEELTELKKFLDTANTTEYRRKNVDKSDARQTIESLDIFKV